MIWSFRNLVCAGASGFMYDFYVYARKDEVIENFNFQHLQKIFFDNWFTTLDLLIYLKNGGILACGTMSANHIEKCRCKQTRT